jgi:hypothetical protein
MPGFGQTKLSKQKNKVTQKEKINSRTSTTGRAVRNKKLAKERQIDALNFNDYQKEMEILDFMAQQKATNDLPDLKKRIRASSKIDNSVKTPDGKTRVWNANGTSYLIDTGDRDALKIARSVQYFPGGIAAFGSDSKNNVDTHVTPPGGGNMWVKPQQSFQEFQANSPEDNRAQEVVPPSQGVPIHPVTGLRIEKGDNWNSYTEAPSGTTYNNSNFNWNNLKPDGNIKSPTGNVAGLSQQEIDVLYGRPPSPVEPKQQDIDFSGIANWWRKNVGK